jgi:glycosyltransferase 2 family protein
MTVFIRFFQRLGLPPATAVAAGAIDSLTGNVIQIVLVVLLALFSAEEVSLGLKTPGSGALHLLWIVIGLVLAVNLVVFLVDRVRNAVVGRAKAWWPQVRQSLGALRRSNKLLLLVGGNLATEILFAVALGLIARGFGYHLPLTALILINAGTSLVSSLVPVPGGIGIAEFGLEVGLTSAGMTASAAAATVLVYRLATFYVPPTWGFVAFKWLQRNSYI